VGWRTPAAAVSRPLCSPAHRVAFHRRPQPPPPQPALSFIEPKIDIQLPKWQVPKRDHIIPVLPTPKVRSPLAGFPYQQHCCFSPAIAAAAVANQPLCFTVSLPP